MDNLDDYWLALDRLKMNKPSILPKNSLINKDSVALEAGRKRGSIKKSRSNFNELILAIQLAAEQAPNSSKDLKYQLVNVRKQKDTYRDFYHQSLNRELMLIERLVQLEKQLKRYVNVTPIKS